MKSVIGAIFSTVSIALSCSSGNRIVFNSVDTKESVTVFDFNSDRYIFLGDVITVEEGLNRGFPFIRLNTSRTTILSDAVFLCWSKNGGPVKVFCPNTTLVEKSFNSLKLKYSPTDQAVAGKVFHQAFCFEYGYETGFVFPEGRAEVKIE